MIWRLCTVFGFVSLFIVAQVYTGPAGGPKYLPCPDTAKGKACNEDLGHDTNNSNTSEGCTRWCTVGPMRFTPSVIEGCQNEDIQGINLRVDGGRMDTPGNRIDNSGGEIDWGDGSTTQLVLPFSGSPPNTGTLNQNFDHPYAAAQTYYPSATFGRQFAYSSNGQGSCGYRCRLQQSAVAIIYLSNSPQCATGHFKANAASKAYKKKELARIAKAGIPLGL